MKIVRLSGILLSTLLTGSLIMPAAAASEEKDFPMDPSALKPWLNSNVIGMVTEDVQADVQDDFYLAVNHDWLASAQLRPGYTSESPLHATLDLVKDRCIALLTDDSLTGDDAELIQSYYELWLDWDARNDAGLTHFVPMVEKLMAVKDLDEMTEFLLSEENSLWGTPLAEFSYDRNSEDSSRYEVRIVPGGLSLEDSDEYEELSSYGESVRQANHDKWTYMLSRFGLSEQAEGMIADVLDFEGKLAPFIYSEEDNGDPDVLQEKINPVTMEELRELLADYPLCAYMEKYGYADSEWINLDEPRWLEALNALYTEENLEEIRACVLMKFMDNIITCSDEEAFRKYQEIERVRDDLEESKSDEQLAYEECRGDFPNQFGRLYTQKYFTAEDRERIASFCREVIDTYREMLRQTEWLSDETKEKAIEKLDKMDIRVIYPDKWEDDSMVRITPKKEGGSYAKAQEEFVRTLRDYEQELYVKPADPELWITDILQSNAAYVFGENAFYIYAGYLGEEIYRSDMTIEELYGGLGHTIAHEISHAFDPKGALYDADGNMADWWTPEDKEAFRERTKKLIAWYDNVTAFDDGTACSGTLWQAEAVADMAGLKCLLKMAGKTEGFDYDRFFRADAAFWRRLDTLPKAQMITLRDSHPLHYLRGNVTMQQFDEFLETYDIQPGDGMYLAPEDRITVW